MDESSQSMSNPVVPETTVANVTSEAVTVKPAVVLTKPAVPTTNGKKTLGEVSRQASAEDANQGRRSSSRSIKRKKFDDELVESSISSQAKTRNRVSSISFSPGVPLTPEVLSSRGSISATSAVSPLLSSLPSSSSIISVTTPTPPVVETVAKKPKPPPSAATKRRRNRNAHQNAVKDIGRWKPQDDLALVLGVQQTSDLETVHRGVKFTCRFTLKEIEDRWYALLYDPAIAKIAVAAMRQLHPDIIVQCHRKALFSENGEEILKTILSSTQPTDETFEELLTKHPEVFLPHRTAKCLNHHWSLMKHYHLLPDQTLLPLPRHEEVVNFSDAEDIIERETRAAISSGQLTATPGSRQESDILSYELNLADRKAKKEVRHLENEIPKWQVLVDSITGVAPSDFDNQTLAVLRGRLVRYLMRSKEITVGRSTKDATVDVDLALEGPANKISRRQGLIKLQPNGEFVIANTGKRPFYVDSKPVLHAGSCAKLNNNSVVEISGLRFVFLVNQDLIASVRAEALKSHLPS